MLSERIKRIGEAFKNLGGWFIFLFIVYLIFLIKIATIDNYQNNLFFQAYSMIVTGFILSRFLFAYFHRPVAMDENYQPSVTFVVPAKNEQDNIAETIMRFNRVDYPKTNIEVIAINDGSTDNTLWEMLRAKRQIGGEIRIDIIDWKKNRGKREGMAEGIKRASHDIIIFVDSDSFVDKDCVKNLVKYFSDPKVGAVSGHTDVYNKDTNLLTKMQALRYYVAFKIYKSAESLFGAVTCCPGCCSAYRKEYLMEFLEPWLKQKFLGVQCTYGDDRSLTNKIIKKYKAVYSDEAKAWTVVPDTLRKYIRQQQRWKKSWVRETLIASNFMWKKNPLAALSFYSYIFIAFTSPLVFFRAVAWYPAATGNWPIVYLAGLFLMLLLHGIFYSIEGGKSWLSSVVAFWVVSLMLIWQLPWALLTIRDPKWGTR
ncbi:glycosyltransferase family 2 protein [Candidatus Parcubacteria bacterium]|nr:MAG: glycosyltransferase family 2 protein [Candidatus Parcubacteria bacterium]